MTRKGETKKNTRKSPNLSRSSTPCSKGGNIVPFKNKIKKKEMLWSKSQKKEGDVYKCKIMRVVAQVKRTVANLHPNKDMFPKRNWGLTFCIDKVPIPITCFIPRIVVSHRVKRQRNGRSWAPCYNSKKYQLHFKCIQQSCT